jgi:tetratricopeptide (TPR) repeat protein
MPVNTHVAPAKLDSSMRSKCLWLRFKAKVLLVFGLRTQAHAVFQDILDINPQDVLALNSLGCEELGRSHEAELAFRKALEMDEKMDRAWYGLGLVLVRQRRFDESLVAFKRNTELQSMSPYAWYQMARVHMELHQPDKALEVMRHLKGFEPKVAAQLERETGLRLDQLV